MHVAHGSHVLSMLDGDALEAIIKEENPDYIIPEIEAIATDRLVKLEEEGYNVIPTAKATIRHMWSKCAQYLKKMGGLILIASIVVWLLSYYPRPQDNAEVESPRYEQSYMGKIGGWCQPIFEPMDMEWQATVALLSGIPAKEIVVSTMNVLYAHPNDEEAESDDVLSEGASNRIANSMSIPTAVAFLIFSLLYLPCIATIMAIGSELNWKWAVGSALYNTTIAWLIAWIAYHITLLLL